MSSGAAAANQRVDLKLTPTCSSGGCRRVDFRVVISRHHSRSRERRPWRRLLLVLPLNCACGQTKSYVSPVGR